MILLERSPLVDDPKRGCSTAVFLVHVLHTDLTTEALLAQNSADLDSFISALTHGRHTGVGPRRWPALWAISSRRGL